MFVYLSKKISIPNNIRLHCVSWNKEHGYIACGGDDGLLKVLKLESGKVTSNTCNTSAPSNLSMNQTLEGHNGAVQVVTWNESQSQKLTSSDQYGLITVWMLYTGSWHEEMINNRNKSVVTDMVWNAEGQRICIVYEDGAVIVGSVDGNRIWGRELKGMSLTHAEWSPDGRRLLFGLRGGDVHVFDHSGNAVSQIRIRCFQHSPGANEIAGLQWYNGKGGYVEPNCPCLVVCYKSGHMQIMRGEDDDDPILLEGGSVKVVAVRWNGDGSILALAGTVRLDDSGSGAAGGKECNVVQFYTSHGILLRTLKVPGKQIADCSWEGGGLRLALAIDSCIYFANIRPDYKWCYFANSVVYTYSKADRSDVCVVFWDTKNNQRYVKFVKHLVAIATGSKSEYCVLSTRADEDDGRFALVLCNAIGTPVDSKYVDMSPVFLSMSPTIVLAASKDRVAVWCYRTHQVKTSLNLTSLVNDDENYCTYNIERVTSPTESPSTYRAPGGAILDPICCVCHSDAVAMVARASGLIHQFTLPQMTLVRTHITASLPHLLAINCNASRVSVIDGAGAVSFLELDVDENGVGEQLAGSAPKRLDRKDVWDLRWSVENAELFVLMEKTRMYVFRNLEPEEPIVSNGHVCSFEDLQIRTVLLDELLKCPESPAAEMVVDVEVKSLRDTRQLLEKVGLADALQFVEDNSHPRLWRLLAEVALDAVDLPTAESAFVRCKDYPAIMFVKSLRNIQNEKLRRAEVAAHFHRFDEAERLYLEMDRRDLAVALRRKLGDWFRVVQLLKCGGAGGDDAIYSEAWNAIGDYYADRQKWEEAVRYYEQARNVECQARCLFAMEDYTGLEQLSASVAEGDKLLTEIADMFATMGMCEQAVAAYIRDGSSVKKAIDCCVTLNNWGKAVELAEKHHVREIGPLLSKYARHLLDEGKVSSAVELYRKAGKFLDAARLLCKTAREAGAEHTSPLHVKKLYVLGGLLMEEHRHRQLHATGERRVSSVISGLLEEEQFVVSSTSSDDKLLDGAWQGAEAYHFYLLAQRQMYGGFFDAAMKTALHLQNFENVIDAEEIYLLIALASCANRNFHVCSQAFIKLESLESITKENRQQYEMLAMDIFVKHSPQDLRTNMVECPVCSARIPDWCNMCSSCNSRYPLCTVTGCPLLEQSSRWTCHRCRRCAGIREMTSRKICPLCHASV